MGKGGQQTKAPSVNAQKKISLEELSHHRTPNDGKFIYKYDNYLFILTLIISRFCSLAFLSR